MRKDTILGHTCVIWRLSVKVGDLVKYNSLGRVVTGIVIRFDRDDDPVIFDHKTGVACANWKTKVKVVSESR
jgi:hypothetical protein